MRNQKSAVFLIASPRGLKSTSASLAGYLAARLARHGMDSEALLVHRCMESDKGTDALLTAVDRSDLVVLAAPVYADSIPGPAVKALESIARRRAAVRAIKPKRFCALIASGYPDASECDTALSVCRIFARQCSLVWAGGLATGAGELLSGKPLTVNRVLARNAMRAINISAKALASGEAVPYRAAVMMARPVLPPALYVWLAHVGFFRAARRHDATYLVNDRPYSR